MKLPLALLPLLLLIPAGCYHVAGTVQKGADLTPAQLSAVSRLAPDQQRAALDAMATRGTIFSIDVFQQVSRTYKLTKAPDGTVTFDVMANHQGDTEMLRAAMDGAGTITGAAVSAALGRPLPSPGLPSVIPIAKPPDAPLPAPAPEPGQ